METFNIEQPTCFVGTMLQRKRCPLPMNQNNDVRMKPALTPALPPGERENGFPRPGKAQALDLEWFRDLGPRQTGFFGVN